MTIWGQKNPENIQSDQWSDSTSAQMNKCDKWSDQAVKISQNAESLVTGMV